MQNNEPIKAISKEDWDEHVVGSSLPVFAEFWAPWCGPCRAMAPLIEALAREYGNQANFVRVNVDESPEIAAKYRVFSVPTFMVLVKGEPIKRFVGMATKRYMVGMLKPNVGD